MNNTSINFSSLNGNRSISNLPNPNTKSKLSELKKKSDLPIHL
jgi:hypothetical protein